MKKTFAGILAGFSALVLLLGILLGGVFLCTTSRAYYRYEYAKYGQAETIGISDDGLMRITNSLLDYLMGKRENLDMQAEIGGELREVFREREKLHMIDVLKLVTLSRYVMLACFVVGILAWIIAFILGKQVKGGLARVGWGYIIGAGILLLLVGVVVILAMRDFTSVFIEFHHIFFDNDLWLLDADDMLIMMVPEEFFADCAAVIAILFGIGLLITVLVSVLLIVRSRRSGEIVKAVSAPDGAFYRMTEKSGEDTSEEDIFTRFGLSDDSPDELALNVPETVVSQTIPVAIPNEIALNDAAEDLTVRFEMKLDLKVEKRENGKLLLKMDPAKQPQVTLSSVPGQLNFSLEGEQRYESLSETAGAALEPAPSPEELLRQMDDLMRGYPSQEGEKK